MRRTFAQLVPLAILLGVAACSGDTETITKEITKEVVPACSPTQPQGACDAGETCFEGACVASSTLCSLTNPTGTCQDGMSCYAGGCVLSTALCSDANPSGACEVGDTCLAGTCVATASVCSATNKTGVCPDGQYCQDGICAGDTTAACDQQVYSAQPVIGVREGTGKVELTVDGLTFKDSDGDGELDPYEDWRLLEICRARDLVSKMDLPRKIGLMSEGSRVGSGTEDGSIPDNVRSALLERHRRYALIRVGSRSAAELATYLDNVQELVEAEAFGIPVTITADPLQGFGMSTNANTGEQTINDSQVVSGWPYPLGLGAINDTQLTRRFGDIVRQEFRGMGFAWELGPMADSATEPRWARVQNTFGENAFHVALHTKECIAGFQGVGLEGGLKQGIAATMKHFPGAGPNEDGMDSHSYVGRYNVFPGSNWEYHMMPFQAAIDVGVAAVMPCYSVFVDHPDDPQQVGAAFSYGLMTETLKKRMGFTGMVTGDWGALADGYNTENLTLPQRAAMWLEAGSHQLGSDDEINFQYAYDLGYVTEAQIDEAATKILEMTFKLGLFENPYTDPSLTAMVRSQEFRTEGFNAQKKAIVLLRNQQHEVVPCSGRNCPPLPRYLPISGSRYLDANENGAPDPGEYTADADGDGTIHVYYDGVVDGLVADIERPDAVTDVFGAYDYTSAGGEGSLPIAQADTLADADIAILRITARKGVYFGLDAGVPLSFDGPFPGNDNDSTINAAIVDRNRVIDAFRVRDGYTQADGTVVPAANPDLKIVLVMHMDRPGIVEPFINGLTTLDELPGEPGSYPLVSDPANIDETGLSGVDAFLVEFGAFDRAVLDFLFDLNPIEGWNYGQARLPMQIPSSDEAVEAQFEDVPADTVDPTYALGAGMTY